MKNIFVLLLFAATAGYGTDQDTLVGLDDGDITDNTDQDLGDCSGDCPSIKEKQVEEDLTKHPFYKVLHSKDCFIPEGTQVVHYPMIHLPAPESFTSLSEETSRQIETFMDLKTFASFSNFNFVKFVEKYPSALVFSESLWTQDMLQMLYPLKDYYQSKLIYDEIFKQFSEDINHVILYKDLDPSSVELLNNFTEGTIVAFITGIVDEIFPSTRFSSLKEVLASYWEKHDTDMFSFLKKLNNLGRQFLVLSEDYRSVTDEFKKRKIKETAYHTYKEQFDLNKLQFEYLMTYREKLLFESVEYTISQPGHQDKLAIINYGAGHTFFDDFKNYNFYMLPYACTVQQSYLSSPQFTIMLLGLYTILNYLPVTDDVLMKIMLSEILDRLNHFSQEERKAFKELLDNLSKTTSGMTSPLEATSDAIKTYFLMDFDQSFEYIFNHYISLSDSDRKKAYQSLDEALQNIQSGIPF